MTKTGCTSCTKLTISLEVAGFRTRTHLLQRDFIFLNSILFVCSKCTIQRHIRNFQEFLTSIGIFRAFTYFFWASWPWNWKALQMNSENVESLHAIIISPTLHVLKIWEGYDKNWMHFGYKTDNLSRSITVSNENSSLTKGFHFFELIWTPYFVCSKCTIQRHITKFQQFLTSFGILHAFTFFFDQVHPEI